MAPPGADMVAVDDLVKHYEAGFIRALNGVSFQVAAGEAIALMGPSGCGKTTLLNLIAALDRPTSGEIRIDGKPLDGHRPFDRFRSTYIGFVFQLHHLIPVLTLIENVEVAAYPTGLDRRRRREKAAALLVGLGLADRMQALPSRLSGGERQRGAVARALINDPRIILADEPTGNVDSETGARILELLTARSADQGTTVIIATHSQEVARAANRTVYLRDGLVEKIA
ncbi:MAG TPA: ABC transporter ATP-binding protein [Candidatus Methylomirabilis sp.]|nr:ABC transporter ATP-binding protein [Candidatus Methylomirabilis sp.]